ncbi:helix-turn-helix domain-containing protein [Paenibacillus thailandensis]
MSVEQAAKYLGVCRATAYNWCNSGELPSFKVGNTRRIRKDTLVEWIEKLESKRGDPHDRNSRHSSPTRGSNLKS